MQREASAAAARVKPLLLIRHLFCDITLSCTLLTVMKRTASVEGTAGFAKAEPVPPPLFEDAQEDECTVCCLRLWGLVCCFIFLVLVSSYLAMGVAVADSTDMPDWTQTWAYLSLAHRLSHWETAAWPPPPPPSF